MLPSPKHTRCAHTEGLSVRRRVLPRACRAFARDESGAFLIFGVYVFLIILIVAGLGIDIMRTERDRANLQYTLDRAVLAAADLDQTLPPSEVVADYFAKAGLSNYLANVTVDEGAGYRSVTASAFADIPTQFIHMLGQETLSAPAASGATESIGAIEISLVLDVSGSMNSNNRLTNLKTAARDFVDNLVDNSVNGDMSMSIIPYATQVSAPDELFSALNVSNEHNYSNCVNFAEADFNTSSIDVTQPLERTMHFDVWRNTDGRGNTPPTLVTFPICEADDTREMLPLQNDRNVLKNFITALTARGNTSIDIGMKWATALLDPSQRPVVDQLVGVGMVPGDFSGRPFDYGTSQSLKVIVLMTDGQNTSQYYIEPPYRNGDSNVWWNAQEREYSIYHPAYNAYYVPREDRWYSQRYGYDGVICEYESGSWDNCGSETQPGDAVRLSYPELWAYTTLQWNMNYNYAPWMGTTNAQNQWFYGVRSAVGTAAKNNRMQAICDAAKAQDIVVFTIGFEAPSSGEAVLRDCASSPSHYFDVNGLEIVDAFEAIASSIRKLRLTQ